MSIQKYEIAQICNDEDYKEFVKYLISLQDKYYEEVMILGFVISKIKDEKVFYK